MKWSLREINYLEKYWCIKRKVDIAKHLKRSSSCIDSKANELGLKKRKLNRWTESDSLFLVENFGNMTTNEVAIKLNRCIANVSLKARELGLCKNGSYRWTDDKLKYIIHNYNNKSFDVMKKVTGFDKEVIYSKAHALGLSRFI